VVFTREEKTIVLEWHSLEEKRIVGIVFYCNFRDNGDFLFGQSRALVDFMLIS
jgi:hypothetical protein